MKLILGVQVATYAVLGAWMLSGGDVRLGSAQILLAGVQALVFGLI